VRPLRKLRSLLRAVHHDTEWLSVADAIRIIPWRSARASHRCVRVHPRVLGHPVWVRIGTTDYQTLRNTVVSQYHLPLQPLAVDSLQLGAKPVILDLGANAGYTVAHFAAVYPTARIVGVEMDAENVRLAQRNTASPDYSRKE